MSPFLDCSSDTTSPSVTIDQASGQSDPDTDGSIDFDVVFDEVIDDTTFTCADVDLSSSTATVTCTSVTNSGDDMNFVVNVTATAAGDVIANIPAG